MNKISEQTPRIFLLFKTPYCSLMLPFIGQSRYLLNPFILKSNLNAVRIMQFPMINVIMLEESKISVDICLWFNSVVGYLSLRWAGSYKIKLNALTFTGSQYY